VQNPSPQIEQSSGHENGFSVNLQIPSPQGSPQSTAQLLESSAKPQVPSPQ
jgi:hypothetical protein